jgi:hypothetical protein
MGFVYVPSFITYVHSEKEWMTIGIRKEVGNNLETLNKSLLYTLWGGSILSPRISLSYSIFI